MKINLAVLEFDSAALDLDSVLSRVGVGSADGTRVLIPERLTSRSSSTVRKKSSSPAFFFFLHQISIVVELTGRVVASSVVMIVQHTKTKKW